MLAPGSIALVSITSCRLVPSHVWLLCDSRASLSMRFPRLLCPWDLPGKNTGVGCYFLLQGIFWTQGLNLQFLCWQVYSLPLNHLGSPMSAARVFNFSLDDAIIRPKSQPSPSSLYSVAFTGESPCSQVPQSMWECSVPWTRHKSWEQVRNNDSALSSNYNMSPCFILLGSPPYWERESILKDSLFQ